MTAPVVFQTFSFFIAFSAVLCFDHASLACGTHLHDRRRQLTTHGRGMARFCSVSCLPPPSDCFLFAVFVVIFHSRRIVTPCAFDDTLLYPFQFTWSPPTDMKTHIQLHPSPFFCLFPFYHIHSMYLSLLSLTCVLESSYNFFWYPF